MSEDDRLIRAFSNLNKRDAEFFSSFLEYLNQGESLAQGASKSDAAFNFMRRLMRSQLPTYKALRRRLPNGGISKDDYRSFVSNTFELFAKLEKITGFERDSRDLAAKSFYATRNGLDPLEYLSGPKDNWVGYDPNNGPLAQRFRELEAVDAQRRFRIRNAGKRKSSLSGIAATDELANIDRINSRLDFLNRLRTFRRATQASGFSRYARAEQESNERIDYERELEAEELHRRRMSDKSFEFEMLDKDEQFIQGAMRDKGWSRDQAEQVYFKNLTENTKWLRLIGKNNPAIAKNLIPIAKAVGKASGLPIIGALARNPALGAITALIGGGLSAGSYSLSRSGTLAKWMNARAVTGDIGPGTFSGLAATGMSYDQMLQSLAKYSVKSSEARFGGGFDKYAELAKYGVDVSGLFNPYLTAEERRSEEYRVISSANQADRAAIMSILGMSPEEYRSERLKNTARSKWSLSDLQLDIYQGVTKKMKENHPILDFFVPDKFYQFHSLLAANKELEDRKFFGDKAVDARNEIYNLHRWDEIRETAEIDDRYRAGMYDNSTTNNNGGDRSVTVIQNINAEVKDSDPVGFVKEMTLLGGRGKHEAESVLQNNDSLRTN